MPETPESPAGKPTARNVYVFGATSFLNDTASEMAYWILPAYLKMLGAGPVQLGLIEGVAESVASLTKLASGYLTDKLSRRKPLVVFGYVLANIVKPLLAIATNWWQILLIRFADRVGKGVRGAPRDVMLAESVDRKKIGAAFGLLQAMDSAGAIAGPLLALGILSLFQRPTAVFWAAAVPGFLCIIVLTLFVRETRGTIHPQPQPAVLTLPADQETTLRDAVGGIHDAQRERHARLSGLPTRFWYVIAAVFVFSIGNSSDMFLVLRANDIGIAEGMAPLLGLVFNITYTATSWPAGRLSDRFPKPLIAAAGYAVFALTYATFAFAPSRAAIWASMAFYGLFYALTNPVLRALVVETVAPAARGRAFGIFFFVTSVCTLFASLITGTLWKQFGAPVPFLLSASLAALAGVMLVLVKRTQPAV